MNINEYSLVYDFTVSEGETNIILYCEGSTAESGSDRIADITHLIAPDGSPSGDTLKAGTYTGKIKLSDLNYSNVNLKESGKLTISTVQIFSVNGGKITFNKFCLEENIPEINDIGYDAQGLGYFLEESTKTALIRTTDKTLSGRITLPDKIQKNGTIYQVIGIGMEAFADCKEITEITLPEGYTSIGKKAFSNCFSLTKVNLPASLAIIFENPFPMCDVSEINLNANNENYTCENNVLFSKDKKTLVTYPSGKTETEYTIPDGVTTIANYAFYCSINLQKIHIPDSVTYIGEGTFSKSNITSITIPDGVESINFETFLLCSFLETVSIPKSVKHIEFGAFEFCTSLRSFNIDKDNPVFTSVDGIVYSKNGEELVLFPQGNRIESFTIPSTVKKICAGAFEQTYSLRSLVIPETVEEIEYHAFYQSFSLSDITFPDTYIHIDADAFEDSKWYSNQPDGVVYAGKIAYGYKGSIPQTPIAITIKDGTLGTAYYAFSYQNINAVTLPDSLISINEGTFEYCDRLTSINHRSFCLFGLHRSYECSAFK